MRHPVHPRARFEVLLHERIVPLDAWQKELDEGLMSLARRRHPKKKVADIVRARDLLGRDDPEFQALHETMGERVTKAFAKQKEIDAELVTLAQGLDVHATTDKWRCLDVARSSDYSTQGFGATRYAEASADLMRANASRFTEAVVWREATRIDYGGIPVCFRGESHSTTFAVVVRVDSDIDLEILKRKRTMTLREQVAWCWRNGVNPRVYNPFLEPGYEERVGLDYQGRDVVASSSR